MAFIKAEKTGKCLQIQLNKCVEVNELEIFIWPLIDNSKTDIIQFDSQFSHSHAIQLNKCCVKCTSS